MLLTVNELAKWKLVVVGLKLLVVKNASELEFGFRELAAIDVRWIWCVSMLLKDACCYEINVGLICFLL